MKIYTGDKGTKHIVEIQKALGVGSMLTPNASLGRKHHYEVPVALDNGAFSAWQRGCGFDEFSFLKMLSIVIEKNISYELLVTPDIVAGGVESLNFSLYWRDRLAGWGRQYLAVQDGMSVLDVSGLEYKFSGIFVGGTNEWKWKTAHEWVCFAHANGLKCHIGRCGTVNKLLYAEEIGADSVDSTNFARNDDFRAIEQYYMRKGLTLFKCFEGGSMIGQDTYTVGGLACVQD